VVAPIPPPTIASHTMVRVDELETFFRLVVTDAILNFQTHKQLIACAKLPHIPSTDSVRQLLAEYDTKQWMTLGAVQTSRYTSTDFCYISDLTLLNVAFQKAHGIRGRFDVQKFINKIVCSEDNSYSSDRGAEYFVLSKTGRDMTWHVDGGVRSGYDLAVYNVLGPPEAVHCFMFLVVDVQLHAEAVARHGSTFPSCLMIYNALKLLDDSNIPVKTPDMTNCEATFCNLKNKPYYNGIQVRVISVSDTLFRVEHISGSKIGHKNIVHPRYLQFKPGYTCQLPDEISSVLQQGHSPVLKLALQTGVIKCAFRWAREGDVLVFDGSCLHAVKNWPGEQNSAALALAWNYRQLLGLLLRMGMHG